MNVEKAEGPSHRSRVKGEQRREGWGPGEGRVEEETTPSAVGEGRGGTCKTYLSRKSRPDVWMGRVRRQFE